jgi:hypothetical protein
VGLSALGAQKVKKGEEPNSSLGGSLAERFLAVPFSRAGVLFERMGRFFPAPGVEIWGRWRALPVYLPEWGAVWRLETTSRNIESDFLDVGMGRFPALLTALHHSSEGRAVTWGSYEKVSFPRERQHLLLLSLWLGLLLHPSAWTGRLLTSPSHAELGRGEGMEGRRWCKLEGEFQGRGFTCTYHLNLFLTFLDPGEKGGVHDLWLGSLLRVRAFRAKLLLPRPDGWVDSRRIYLTFREGDENLRGLEKGIYLCVTETLNGYRTNFPTDLSGKDVHLVRFLYPILHSPLDLVPLLSPPGPLGEGPAVRAASPKEPVRRVLNFLRGKEGERGGGFDGAVQSELLYRGLVEVREEEGRFVWEAVSPLFLARLLKREVAGELRGPRLCLEACEGLKEIGISGSGQKLYWCPRRGVRVTESTLACDLASPRTSRLLDEPGELLRRCRDRDPALLFIARRESPPPGCPGT